MTAFAQLRRSTIRALAAGLPALVFTQACASAGTSADHPAAAAGAPAQAHWSYAGADGPEAWGRLSPEFAQCATGRQQSPIDITAPAEQALPAIEFHYQPAAATIVNNGHTVQANYERGNSITVQGERYELLQLHFHHPSEHLIAGRPAEMEMHLVHRSAQGAFAVVGVMIERGSAQDIALGPVLDTLPQTTSDQRHVRSNPGNYLPHDGSYYTYPGSLTTPPCSEGIRWLLLATPQRATPAQIDGFARLYPLDARPVQPLQGRQVQRRPQGT